MGLRGLRGVLLLALLTACAPHAPADDLTISTRVKIELIADPRLGAMRVQASTLNGVVTLSGTVPSQGDVDRATTVARRVPGVRDVKSELQIGG
jgi:hyperosmotically inducible protein